MKHVSLGKSWTFAFIAAFVIGSLLLAQAATLANVGPATQPNAQMALPPPVPANLNAQRIGSNVSLTWTYTGPKVKGFYIFHVASATQPPADWEKGGWANDTIVDGSTHQANLSVVAATKPNHNYYLICIAGQGTAYYCSAVAMERPSYTAPAPIRVH